MPWYSKNGWEPQTKKDDTSGWVEVDGPPADIPEGKQLTWLNREWVVRDPKPEDRPGFQWNWQHDTKTWVESAWGDIAPLQVEDVQQLSSAQITNLTTAQL